MNELKIDLADARTAYEPGEEVAGSVSWQFDKPARDVELRLFWFTRGRGIEDAGVIETIRFEQPLQQETRLFRLQLPQAPYSFSGKLISLVWALELVSESGKAVSRQEIVMAPAGKEVQLGTVSLPPIEKRSWSISWQTRTQNLLTR
ncbi:MAG TPA: hypothetical protein VL361_26360 [Candidatus Limnocylindrales bacterium]|nr:hypothetical protein [Candidatus Limnocylindrales bacterium]